MGLFSRGSGIILVLDSYSDINLKDRIVICSLRITLGSPVTENLCPITIGLSAGQSCRRTGSPAIPMTDSSPTKASNN